MPPRWQRCSCCLPMAQTQTHTAEGGKPCMCRGLRRWRVTGIWNVTLTGCDETTALAAASHCAQNFNLLRVARAAEAVHPGSVGKQAGAEPGMPGQLSVRS